ncbi:uncharacterized protein LOC128195410 [Vigna angularis]|uniref:uncharacterized protein LOC128195410 n=1 Tax=Phaseolus angularis TaxID=3914 RepID=UPI0022B5152E|nr:uncharacterized protein LOC128195410 [Vigna angularis]
MKLNFKRCNYDDCVYILHRDNEVMYLLLYVDDILIASSDMSMIHEMKAKLGGAFEMKELEEARRILGINIKRDNLKGNLFLSQKSYLQKVISRYRMVESKPADTPIGQHLKFTKEQCPKTEAERRKMKSIPFSSGIGSIMYGMVCTRPDLAHGMKVLLGSQDVWNIVEDEYNEPEDDKHQTVDQIAALKKARVKDRPALYFLYNAVDEYGFEKIINAKSAKEAWEILKVAYKGDTRVKQVRVQALRREFEQMEMNKNEGVTEFITRVQKMANQLRMNGKRAEILAADDEEVEDEVDMAEVGHIAKYCKTETNGETNLITEDAEEECGILLMAKSSDMVDMKSPIPTVDEVILVNDATIVKKENLEKELKQKDEEIQRIGRLLDEANEIMNKQRVEIEELKKEALEKEEKAYNVLEPNEEEDEDVEKNPMKMSAKVEKSPKVRNELVKVVEKSDITKSVKALKRSTKSKDRRTIRKKKNLNLTERSQPGVG